jgi:hypothetical protein
MELTLGLRKEIYAGTTSLFFTVGNATKALHCFGFHRPLVGKQRKKEKQQWTLPILKLLWRCSASRPS